MLVCLNAALEWARDKSDLVVLRIGSRVYSAGRRTTGDPSWAGSDSRYSWGVSPAARAPSGDSQPARLTPWRVVARTAWFRDDGEAVARALASAIRSYLPVEGACGDDGEQRVTVSFVIFAASAQAARSLASELLRRAWRETAISAVPGRDFDVSEVRVSRSA